jgi:hypothetical protein
MPEFVFLFEAVAGLGSDALAFVYHDRVALEASAEIHLRIDPVSGVLQTDCFPRASLRQSPSAAVPIGARTLAHALRGRWPRVH